MAIFDIICSTQIKNIFDYSMFLIKNLFSGECAKLYSTSVVVLRVVLVSNWPCWKVIHYQRTRLLLSRLIYQNKNFQTKIIETIVDHRAIVCSTSSDLNFHSILSAFPGQKKVRVLQHQVSESEIQESQFKKPATLMSLLNVWYI